MKCSSTHLQVCVCVCLAVRPFPKLTGVDGTISSENSDRDGGRVSSDNCFKINKIRLEDFVLYNFNEIN